MELSYEISFHYANSHVENVRQRNIGIDDTQGYVGRLMKHFGDVDTCFVHLVYRGQRLFSISAKRFLEIVEDADKELEEEV